MSDADLVVVGGGPAGLATAIGAAARGLRTTVVDSRRPPIDRACGEGIMPDGVERLEELGVATSEMRSRCFRGIRYLDGDRVASADFVGRRGLGVRRIELHEGLRGRAEAVGVELRWGVRALGVADGVVVTDAGDVRGRWVVAADGRNSSVRSFAGLERRRGRGMRRGVRRHFAVAAWSEHVEVHWADEGEAYVTPVADDLVGVALLFGGSGSSFDRMLRHFPDLERRLAGARPASRDLGAGPFGQRCRTPAVGRLALVGDAAGCLDPITGKGITLALEESAALVEALLADDLGRYREAHRRLRRIPLGLTALLELAARRPAFRRRIMRALAGSETLFEGALSIGTGQRPARLLGRPSLLGLAWELARHAI